MNSRPRQKRSVLRSSLTGRATGGANLRANFTFGDDLATCFAEVWMIKMALDESFKFVHTSRVCSDVVMSINKLE